MKRQPSQRAMPDRLLSDGSWYGPGSPEATPAAFGVLPSARRRNAEGDVVLMVEGAAMAEAEQGDVPADSASAPISPAAATRASNASELKPAELPPTTASAALPTTGEAGPEASLQVTISTGSEGTTTFASLAASTSTVATITVGSTSVGITPAVLGYNLGHFMAGSNAADWWRYSGAKAARAFLSVSDIEPVDDISGLGDGVNDQGSFAARRSALRSNAANASVSLDPTYVNWNAFLERYQNAIGDTNRFTVAHAFGALRQQGVEILANITASPSRFPLADSADWANAWELWQHYYAQAFLLGREYAVQRYGIFNEPNNWTWPAGTTDPEANWLRRLRLASDAIQTALADLNSRYGTSLRPEIFAPNTANGATKYNNASTGDTWGRAAVLDKRRRWDDSNDGNWSNFQIYNYQKYDTLAGDYISDFQALRASLDGDGEAALPLALTEFNVRTGANYDTRPETLDSPSDFTALAANSIALSQVGARQLYLFKFGQTARSGGTYPVAKNGTHTVQNGTGTLNNVGGATKGAEAYRLFVKASGANRPLLSASSTAPSTLWQQISRDASSGTVWAYIANTAATPVDLELDLAALGLAEGSLALVEEVSSGLGGGVTRITAVQGGRLATGAMPAQAVWLVTLTPALGRVRRLASADTQLSDGSGRNQGGGSLSALAVRADGSVDGRRVTLLKFNLLDRPADVERVLLDLQAATLGQSGAIQAHVYGLNDDSWTETSTWASLSAALKQNVAAGNQIAHNVVAGQGTTTTILGQLVVNGPTQQSYQLDVSSFVQAQSDGWASFLVVQEHRWDVALPSLTTGDTQSDGLRIAAREAGEATAPALQFWTRSAAMPPSLNGIAVNGTELSLSFSRPITAAGVAASSFTVQTLSAAGSVSPVGVSGLAVDPADPRLLRLTLTTAPAASLSLRVAYSDPAGDQNSGVVQGVDGADLASFSNRYATSYTSSQTVTSLASDYLDLQLSGTASINGTGNARDNTIRGNGAANTLSGGSGLDSLSGGAGNDTFRFDSTPNSSTNRDLITDFTPAADKLAFSKAVYPGFSKSASTLTSSQFRSGAGVTSATSSSQRFLYDTASGILRWDRDGNASRYSPIEVAQLGSSTHPSLAFSDVVLVA